MLPHRLGLAFLVGLSLTRIHADDACNHSKNVDDCFQRVVEATKKVEEGEAISATEEETKIIENVCNLYDEGLQCNEQRLDACSTVTDNTRAKIYTYVNQVIRQGIVRFCGDKEMLRGYIQHSGCMHNQQNETKKCIATNKDAFISAMKKFDSMSEPRAISTYCGLITDLFLCGRAALDNNCGQQAGQLFVTIASDFLPTQMINTCIEKYGRKAMGMMFKAPTPPSAAGQMDSKLTLTVAVLYLSMKLQSFFSQYVHG